MGLDSHAHYFFGRRLGLFRVLALKSFDVPLDNIVFTALHVLPCFRVCQSYLELRGKPVAGQPQQTAATWGPWAWAASSWTADTQGNSRCRKEQQFSFNRSHETQSVLVNWSVFFDSDCFSFSPPFPGLSPSLSLSLSHEKETTINFLATCLLCFMLGRLHAFARWFLVSNLRSVCFSPEGIKLILEWFRLIWGPKKMAPVQLHHLHQIRTSKSSRYVAHDCAWSSTGFVCLCVLFVCVHKLPLSKWIYWNIFEALCPQLCQQMCKPRTSWMLLKRWWRHCSIFCASIGRATSFS